MWHTRTYSEAWRPTRATLAFFVGLGFCAAGRNRVNMRKASVYVQIIDAQGRRNAEAVVSAPPTAI